MDVHADNKAVHPAFEHGSLFPVVMFWMGESISKIAVACMNSVIAQGHELTLYCYKPPKNAPTGVTLDDAEKVLRKEDFVYFHEKNPSRKDKPLTRLTTPQSENRFRKTHFHPPQPYGDLGEVILCGGSGISLTTQ